MYVFFTFTLFYKYLKYAKMRFTKMLIFCEKFYLLSLKYAQKITISVYFCGRYKFLKG